MKMIHGGNIYKYKNVIDFSANINPLGMPENALRSALESASEWVRYPDHLSSELCAKLSEKENIRAENIVCGNGASDLIYRIVHAIRPKNAVTAVPCFAEYEKALGEVDCNTVNFRISELNDFELGEEFLSYLNDDIDMIFLGNPNNPTGKPISSCLLGKIADKCLQNDIFFVCDECFIDFSEKKTSVYGSLNKKIIILKAFTKIYAMPGLRVGYALFGDVKAADIVRRSGQYWSVSVPAQRAALAALDDNDYLKKTSELIVRERNILYSALEENHFLFYRSDADFIFFRGYSGLDDDLLKKNILIRNCSDFKGLDGDFFRIAVRTHEENLMLINALRECVNGRIHNDTGKYVERG